ncbi:MAG: dodecin domain-containing protein [Desulfobacterales bacterium]|nr:MAG: dodecin domain-containing protein [Desulfobacterales bacterium]
MSTYKVIELVGSSYVSWTDAAKQAVETAAKTLRDLRVAEVTRMDMRMEEGGKIVYRARLKLSFKVHSLEKFAETLGAKPYAQEED